MRFIGTLICLCFILSQVYALNPSRTYKQKPDKFNMDYKSVDVPTDDGATIHAWYFPSKSTSSKIVVISHNGEGNMADYLRRVDQFRSEYNVLIYDYRGYGESSDFEIDNNMYIYPHFQNDLKAVYKYISNTYRKLEITSYGFGMGAGLAFGVGYHTYNVKNIIADTPFLSMEDLENRFESMDAPMDVPFAGYERQHEPIGASETQPQGELRNVLILIGSNDALYTEGDYEGLVRRLSSKTDHVAVRVIENPDRKDNFRVNKAQYFEIMREFIQ